MNILTHQSKTGITFRVANWGGLDLSEKPLIIFLNGRTEFVEKYNYFFDRLLNDFGLSTFTWDHRGQGKSGGKIAHIDNFDQFVDDADELIKKYVHKDQKYYLMSHSMGGLISLNGIRLGAFNPLKLILFSPFLGVYPKPFPPFVAKTLANSLNRVGFGNMHWPIVQPCEKLFPLNPLTRDRERYNKMLSYGYPYVGPTVSWLHTSFKTIDDVLKETSMNAISKYPIFMGTSGADTIVNGSVSSIFAENLKKKYRADLVYKSYPSAKHELLAEIPETYESLVSDLVQYLN